MTALEQLNAYLRRLEGRLRLLAAGRGAALVAGCAVLLTVLLAWICNRFGFAEGLILPVRLLLYVSIAGAISFGLVVPLLRLNRRLVARRAEERLAGFNQRLLTLTERADPADPFTELLAEDALEIAKTQQPAVLAPTAAVAGFFASAAVAVAILCWLIFAAPGYLGYGASLLWAGKARSSGPLYDISVRPGNRTIRRKSDQLVSAQLLGFSSDKVTLFAKRGSSSRWEQVAMQPERGGNGYEFLFAGLSEPVEYYVGAGSIHSRQYKIDVKDLPGIKRIKVAVHFPEYLGLKDQVDDPGGDVRAVEGSRADISVLTDRPLEKGVLVLENGQKVDLAHGESNWVSAQVPVSKDGSYHVAAIDGADSVRLSEDYFIEARKDSGPVVKIVRPQRDPHVSPIEELPIAVEASDDFGLNGLALHYAVNGGPEQTITLLNRSGRPKQAERKTMLSLEDFKVAPGDLVSFYATANDAKNTARTDIYFAQADPFDLRFQQSQQAGGGGGGGANESGNIAERQKEIIAATWNELKNGAGDKKGVAEEANFLSGAESKLSQQAKTLADRMRSRQLSSNSAEFDEFSKQMDRASAEMGGAVDELKKAGWKDALPPEQRALQALMRAESLFRNIQVAYSRMNGGGGGASANAGRDLERMLDLEMDPEKNQYESGQSAVNRNQQQEELQDALERLKALARRQQELAQQQQQQKEVAQQRWEQEMLRREAEELQRQIEQMSRSQQQSASSSSQSSSSRSSSQGGSQSASRSSRQGAAGQRNGENEQAGSQAQREQWQQATNALQRAQEEMRGAVSRRDASAQQRAANALQQAENQLRGLQQGQAGNSLSDLASRAQQLTEQQRDFANRLRQAAAEAARNGNRGSSDSRYQRRFPWGGRWNRDPYDPSRRALPGGRSGETEKLSQEKEQMATQLEQLQRDAQRQAQSLSSDQPQVASKLRDAVGSLQQQDLASHMKKNAEWIRQGYGAEAWVNEQSAALGLDEFSKKLQEAKSAADRAAQNGQNGQSAQSGSEAARALQQLQALREQLNRGTREGGRMQRQAGGAEPGGHPAIAEAMQNLANLREQLGPRSGRAYYDSEYAFRYLQDLQGADPAELTARLNREVLPSLDRIEADLKRQARLAAEGSRVAPSEAVPDTYRDAVAEYFKKLSNQ